LKIAPQGSENYPFRSMESVFMVKVSPGASGNEIKGWIGEALKVRVKASPEKGKANKELRRFLAKTLGIAPRQVAILSGNTSRDKKVSVQGMEESEIDRKLSRQTKL